MRAVLNAGLRRRAYAVRRLTSSQRFSLRAPSNLETAGAVAVQRFEPRPLSQSGFRGSCRAISPVTEEMA
jgi:hypothetical protein